MKDIQKKELALSSRAFPEAAAYPLKHSNAIKVSRKNLPSFHQICWKHFLTEILEAYSEYTVSVTTKVH